MKKRTKVDFYGKIDGNGKVVRYTEPIREMLDEMFHSNPGKTFRATYKIMQDAKSYAQLRFYFGVLLPAFVTTTGETDRDKIDHYLREKYLAHWEEIILKDQVRQTMHIPTLQIDANEISKEGMSSYITNCLNELWDMGGNVPQSDIDELYSVMQDDIEDQQLLFKEESKHEK